MSHSDVGRVPWSRRLLEPWTDRIGLVALAVILVQGVWRGWYVARGYFTQDDFVILDLAHDRSLGTLLLYNYSGHVLPARWLLAELVVAGGALAWWIAAALTLVLMVVTSIVMWHVLCRLLPGRPIRVVILALFCFSPLTLWATQQWIVAMQFYPVTLCLLFGVVAIDARIEGAWRPGAWLPVLLLAIALLFQERALILLPAYVGITLTIVSGTLKERLVRSISALWLTWAGAVVVVLAYLAVHSKVAPIRARAMVDSSGDLVSLLGNFIFRTAAPGLVGGPWRPVPVGDAVLMPPAWAVFVSTAILLVALSYMVRRGGRRAAYAWITFAVYAASGVALLFGGRSQFGDVVGLIPRYAADLAPMFAVCAALALRDVRFGGLQGPLAKGPWASNEFVTSASVVMVALVALPTTLAIAPRHLNGVDRQYATNLLRQLKADPGLVLFDTRPPETVLINWFGDDARVSTVLGTLDPPPRFNVPVEAMRIPDLRGRLRPMTFTSPVLSRAAPNPSCGYAVRSQPVSVAMSQPVLAGRKAARFEYFSGSELTLHIQFMSEGQLVRVESVGTGAGLHALYVPIDVAFDSVTLRVDGPGSTLCLGRIVVGRPSPA